MCGAAERGPFPFLRHCRRNCLSRTGRAWAGDYSAAAATFACGNDAAHTRTVQATVTSETRGGSTVYTAVATFEGKAYTDVKTMAGQQGGGTGGTAPAQKPNPKTGI